MKKKETAKHRRQQAALLEAAKPLMEHLAKNFHPHHKAIVTGMTIEVMEGVMCEGTTEFLED